jgi:MFS transporter, DHA2 family, multidrug resistance protein
MSTQPATGGASPKAGRREWIGLAVLALPCLLYSMDLTVLNLAVPHLTADLGPTASELLWIVDIYGFLLAASLITMGTLGDRVGRRKLLLIGAAAFGGASVLAAFSTTVEMLITARALLGLAAATLAPSTLSLLRNMFLDDKERTFAIGVWIASFSAGAAIGPLIGGALLAHFAWGSVFLIAVPVMALLLALGPILLPEYREPQKHEFDVLSAVLSLLSILAIVYGIKRIAEAGVALPHVIVILAGVTTGVVFLRRQQTHTHPLIDLALFRLSAFRSALGLGFIGFFTAFGMFLLIAQHLQMVMGMGPLAAGLWTAPSGLAFVAGSMLAPVFLRWLRPAQVMAGGFALAAVGFLFLTQIGAADRLAILVIGYVVMAFGLAQVATFTTDIIMASAPPERAGAASGINETNSELSGALSIAIFGSVVAALFRVMMSDAIPADVSQETADLARTTLGGAIAAAEQLPAALGEALLTAARNAYTQAIQVVAGICAALSLVASALSLRLRQ